MVQCPVVRVRHCLGLLGHDLDEVRIAGPEAGHGRAPAHAVQHAAAVRERECDTRGGDGDRLRGRGVEDGAGVRGSGRRLGSRGRGVRGGRLRGGGSSGGVARRGVQAASEQGSKHGGEWGSGQWEEDKWLDVPLQASSRRVSCPLRCPPGRCEAQRNDRRREMRSFGSFKRRRRERLPRCPPRVRSGLSLRRSRFAGLLRPRYQVARLPDL